MRKNMNKQRIGQLKMANEEEDKTIRKLEKLLKIDKTKSEKSVPRMFRDGLDYALEMCLPENISKMYDAAKEAADANDESDSEWKEDFVLATGQRLEAKSKSSKQNGEEEPRVSKKTVERLRKAERKYFDVSGDELDSDLSDVDSEFEAENGEDSADADENRDLDDDDDAPPEETSSKSAKSAKKKKPIQEELSDDEEDMLDDGLDDILNEEDSEEEMDLGSGSDIESDADEDDDAGNGEDSVQNSDSADGGVENEEPLEKPSEWEDIYGRKRDKDGNVISESNSAETKYVPPHLRARLAAEGVGDPDADPKRREKLLRLKRLLKGNLNRLSEANMHKIATDVDSLYMQNPHHDMNTTLAALVTDSLITKSLSPERLVLEHMMLIAALHANVGSEVGTHMLEVFIDRFNKILSDSIERQEVEDKTLDNVVLALCHMYTFKVPLATNYAAARLN